MRSRPPLSRVVYAKAFDGATIVPRLAGHGPMMPKTLPRLF
jgi:hypothetical protein